jgi:streptomycin 6-kinase
MTPAPERFARTIREVFGERGEAWLRRLPETLAECERRWLLRIGPPFAELTYNYVAPAERADGGAAVLKLGVPNKALSSEIAALAHFDGRGAVRLLEADVDVGALLLDRLAPGTSLRTVADDAEATRIAAGVMRELWRPAPVERPFLRKSPTVVPGEPGQAVWDLDARVPWVASPMIVPGDPRLRERPYRYSIDHPVASPMIVPGDPRKAVRDVVAGVPFPTVARWGEGFVRLRGRFDGGTGPLPEPLVARAEREFADLLASAGPPTLLHGDLHHDNILAAGAGRWLAIDPKGLVGEAPYETGALLLNPRGPQAPRPIYEWPDLDLVLETRLRILAEELGFEPERMRRWAFAQAVLSAWWSLEDHSYGWEPAITLAEHCAALRL